MTTREEKAGRMQLRKDVGMRVIHGPTVPPYHRGPRFLWPFACFSCRVSFKRSAERGSKKCSNCGGELFNMGRAFKAPKRTNKEQWKKVEKLRRAGYGFPMTSTNAPAYPEKLSEVDDFIVKNPNHPFRHCIFTRM